MIKKRAEHVMRDTKAFGKSHMDSVITETLHALSEMSRCGGFAPCPWVLGRLPRLPASLVDKDERADVGASQGCVDGPSEFGIQAIHGQQARDACVRYDVGHRMAHAMLRKAAPVFRKYKVGDIVPFCRRPRKGESGIQCSIGSVIVGFERGPSDPPQGAPKVCWFVCGRDPVCVATDKIRLFTAAELLVYSSSQADIRLPSGSRAQQEACVHARDPMGASDEGEDLGDECAGGGVPAEGEERTPNEFQSSSPTDVRRGNEDSEDGPTHTSNPLSRKFRWAKVAGQGVHLAEGVANLATRASAAMEGVGFL